MRLGIIGLPQVGKSTIFEALTQTETGHAQKNENRIGTIQVPDERVDILSEMYKPKKTIYAQVEYFLPGKSDSPKEQAIWNQVRDCDALIHVIRNFRGYGVDAPNPVEDFKKLNQELILADYVVAERRIERLGLDKKRGKAIDSKELDLLTKCIQQFENDMPLRNSHELATAPQLRGYAFVSAKPMLILFNNEDDEATVPTIETISGQTDSMVIRGKLEHEIAQMSAEEAAEFLNEFEIEASAMSRVIQRSYELLGIMSFFTVGEDEVRAWTIKNETQAVDAAEVIHSDIKKGFIRAEVLSYKDLMDAETYQEAKKRGTVRLEGKTYIVQNGDIINFRFNV